jgi:hypothetical protein
METERLTFVINRDGFDKARVWAQQTIKAYRRTVLEHRFTQARRAYIETYCVLKRFLRTGQIGR